MMSATGSGPHVDAALHFLDRQLIDPDGRLVGKVDDLELAQREDGRLVVTALLIGPAALGPRIGGHLGQWIVAVWHRLRPDARPQPGRIPVDCLLSIDSAVHVTRVGDWDGISGLEAWLREFVIGRIPGSVHEPD
jgi:hypothetical protein